MIMEVYYYVKGGILFLVCQYKETLRYKSIIENIVYDCRIKEIKYKSLFSKMIIYYMSSQFSGDELRKHLRKVKFEKIKKTIDKLKDNW